MFNLRLTPIQFAVIYEFLYHTQLGARNDFEDEISDLMIALEKDGAEVNVNEVKEEYGNFVINTSFNQDDGVTFSILESN